MSTSNFLDANVWLALIWERHQHSEIARLWFEAAPEASFLFCRFTQITVLRLLTTGSVMGSNVLTMKRAWEIWDAAAADDRIKFAPEPEEIELRFRKHSRLTSVSPKVWADAYLMGFAQAAGLTLVTFDRESRRDRLDGLEHCFSAVRACLTRTEPECLSETAANTSR
jgi:toxin-antitoxin system PIN domain toxin